MKAIITDRKYVVVGLGQTGLSCVRYLVELGKSLHVQDTRNNPPGLDELLNDFPDVDVVLGKLDQNRLNEADEIILSPGISLSTPEIKQAIENGVLVRGDIDIFAEVANAPVIGITGSNGKSTVTTLVGEMAKAAGLNVAVGGNIGVPALSLLAKDVELYVLELSSFQLETTRALNAKSVVLLNLSEDHMDRYPNKFAYLQAKQRIFYGAQNVVVNDDDSLSAPLVNTQMKLIHYGLNGPDLHKFSVVDHDNERFLTQGFERLLNVKALKVRGEHNISNCLAALALGWSVGLPIHSMLEALKNFDGLPHRCQYIRSLNGVDFVNDSKGTNPGAVVTALHGLGKKLNGKILLIAGGDSKGADLSSLVEPIKTYAKAVILMGKDADKFKKLLSDEVALHFVDSMSAAVNVAYSLAETGDLVLLSPACASFDMFKNFEDRGAQFSKEVSRL